MPITNETAASQCGQDFAAWTSEQAAALRAGRLHELDIEHLSEEIEDLGKRERREIVSRLVIIGAHILKFQYQLERASLSWRNTIREQARQIDLVLEDSPSLRPEMDHFIGRSYPNARELASDETELVLEIFPDVPDKHFLQVVHQALAHQDFKLGRKPPSE